MIPVEDIKEVILGVLANALTSLLAQIGRRIGEGLEDKSEKDSDFVSTLRKALESTSEEIEWEEPPAMEEVCLFLTSPEAESVVRQIYSCKIAGQKEDKTLPLIRKEFDATLAKWTGEDIDTLSHASEILFTAVLKGCDEALHIAIENGKLSAHEAMSTFRYRIIKDELAGIKKNLVFLTKSKSSPVKEILVFEEKYRQQVSQRHAHIVPPHFDTARRVPIDGLYVCPRFHAPSKGRKEEPKIISTEEFLAGAYRVVLLGDPGGGKSTFATKICHDLSTSYDERLLARRKLTPILVTLRDYGADKKTLKSSILQFIQTTATSRYQLPVPEGTFEYLLLNGRAIVIFDGLDELLDTSYRQEICADIESFCSLYPAVPVVVTSRKIGYEQAPLDEKEYEVFHLAAFDDNQVKEYVEKWFGLDDDLSADQKKEKVRNFCEESEIVPDLRSNPLMLALMCNIYKGENYIPRNRPDLYEKCAMMLFERWDKTRGIHVTLPFEAHIRPALMHLAHWIYGDEKLQGGVTEEDLVREATKYLCPRRFEDKDEAENAARKFVEFCRGRAWVFTDTGTTKMGERLYQFTHRTFLEYFTAGYLVRTQPTPEILGKALIPRIERREWDVVAQLACQIQNRNLEGGGDQLLDTFVTTGETKRRERSEINLISFAGRCLEFMVPSPKVTRNVARACIEKYLDAVIKGTGFSRRNEEISELLSGILYAANENREIVKKTLIEVLWKEVEGTDYKKSQAALEIGIHPTLGLHFGRKDRPNDETIKFWRETSDEFADLCQEKQLEHKNLCLCITLLYRGKIRIAEIVKWHGVEAIFKSYGYIGFPNVHRGPLAEWLLVDALRMLPQEEDIVTPHILEDLGQIILDWPTPWSGTKELVKRLDMFYLRFGFDKVEKSEFYEINSNALFGYFGLLAAFFDALESFNDPSFNKEKLIELTLSKLKWVWIGRYKGIEERKAQSEGYSCGFSDTQINFIIAWMKREINLVDKKK